MYKLTKTQERHSIIGYAVLIAIASFVGIFFATQIILSEYDKAYGYDFNTTTGPYAEVMKATTDAANQTEGTAIGMYMVSVKAPICDTLKPNQTAVSECLRI